MGCEEARTYRLCGMAESERAFNESQSHITTIPQDHLYSILLLLPVESILCLSTTCKKLKFITYSDSLWESICRRDWGNVPVDVRVHLPWKKLYQQVCRFESVFCSRLLPEACGGGGMPGPRASPSLNLVAGCLVLFGGGCDGGRHLDDTWAAYIGNHGLRRPTIQWQKTNSGIPSGRFGHSCVVIDDSIVLFGGINDHGIRQNDTWIGQVRAVQAEEGSSITLSWRLLDVSSAESPPPRGAHAGCCIDNKRMLIHGGIGPPGVRLGDTWVLNLSDDLYFGTWQEIATRASPPSRSGHTLTHIGGSHTILFGGRGEGYDVLNDVWLLDANWRWAQLLFDVHNIPLPRVGHSANLVIGKRVLIYGGEDSYRRRKDDFWVLDVKVEERRQRWRRVESKGQNPKCRSFHGACADELGCRWYVYGGMVDGMVQPADPSGLRFDGDTFVVELPAMFRNM